MQIAIYHNLPTGGAKRLILNLTDYLINKGHLITLYTNVKGNKDKLFSTEVKLKHVEVLDWLLPNNKKEYLKTINFKYFKNQKILADKIDKKNYDFALIGGDWLTNTSPLSLFLKTPSIYLVHELKREFYEKTESLGFKYLKELSWKLFTKKLKKLEIQSLNKSTKIIVNSIFSYNQIRKLVKDKNKIEVLYPFLPKLFLEKKRVKSKSNYYLIVGGDTYLKGSDFIMNFISNLNTSKKTCFKIVTSNKSYLKNIKKNKKNLLIEIIDPVKDKDLINLYKKANALLYFPRKEPFGLIPIEALSLGCPILAVNEGGFTEIAHYSKNIKLLPKNIEILRSFIFKNYQIFNDFKFKKLLKSKFSVDNYAGNILKIYKEIK